MLSIRFDNDHEWWVADTVFERLFQSALDRGDIAPTLEEWRDVSIANGGLSFAMLEAAVAGELKAGLRAAASAELARLRTLDPRAEDGMYRLSLEKLMLLTAAE